MHYAGVHRTPIMYVHYAGVHPTPYVHYELSLKAERINNVPRPSYGWAVLSVRTALRAVLIWDGMYYYHPPYVYVCYAHTSHLRSKCSYSTHTASLCAKYGDPHTCIRMGVRTSHPHIGTAVVSP